MLCEYGCGQKATHKFSSGKWCCSKNHGSCLYKTFSIKIKNINGILCSYGCGQKATHKFKGGKFCCSKSYNSCLVNREKNSKSVDGKKNHMFGKNHSKEARKKISESNKGEKNYMFGKTHSKEARKKIIEAQQGVPLSKEHRKKIRISHIKRRDELYGRCCPTYNPKACKLIDEYGKENNYNFQHAENGGEFYIKELGYWVDGYDKEKNVVMEIDESFHFDFDGNLKEKDVERQQEIEEYLKCKFIRIRM